MRISQIINTERTLTALKKSPKTLNFVQDSELSPATQRSLGKAVAKVDLREKILNQRAAGVLDAGKLTTQAKEGLETQYATLSRIRDLVREAKNSTISAPRRQEIADAIKDEISNIDLVSETTQFKGLRLLAKDIRSAFVQTGNQSSDGIRIELTEATSKSLKIETLDTSTTDAAQSALKKIDSAMSAVQKGIGKLDQASTAISKVADTLVRDLNNIQSTREALDAVV